MTYRNSKKKKKILSDTKIKKTITKILQNVTYTYLSDLSRLSLSRKKKKNCRVKFNPEEIKCSHVFFNFKKRIQMQFTKWL